MNTRCMRSLLEGVAAVLINVLAIATNALAQQLLLENQYRLTKDNAPGELPFTDFRHIVQFSGYAPVRKVFHVRYR